MKTPDTAPITHEITDWASIRERQQAELGSFATDTAWSEGRPTPKDIAEEGYGSGC